MNIIVIGGGPAGMMAALTAAGNGATVSLWERNTRLGRKLAITGKGRCNLTNQADTAQLVANMPGNGAFLYGAFSRFSPEAVMEYFTAAGLPLKVERGKRVFPQSDRAEDVIAVLRRQLAKAGVTVLLNKRAKQLAIKDGAVQGVADQEGVFSRADAVIVATGGVTYPATGSTGDGYTFAAQAGHTVVKPQPSLVPLETEETWPGDLMGLSLKNVRLAAYAGEHKLAEEFGEMLFTHFGISGPIVLSISRPVIAAGTAGVRLLLDLKPALSLEQLDSRLQRDLAKFSRRHFQNSLDELLPLSLIPVVVKLSGIDPHKPCNQVSKSDRQALAQVLKNLPLTVKCARPLAEAIVTKGGVAVNELSPKTMGSKRISGLYFAGETMDVDGLTGGFNLQAAWSSGFVAGEAATQI